MTNVAPNFHTMIKNQVVVHIKRFRSDNVKEYFNQTLSSYFQQEGIIDGHPISTFHSRMSDRKERWSFACHSLSIPISKECTKTLLGEAVLTTAHLINRLTSRVLGLKSPMEVLSKFYLDLSITNHLVFKIVSCASFVQFRVKTAED